MRRMSLEGTDATVAFQDSLPESGQWASEIECFRRRTGACQASISLKHDKWLVSH
jgi:hypothetical protein